MLYLSMNYKLDKQFNSPCPLAIEDTWEEQVKYRSRSSKQWKTERTDMPVRWRALQTCDGEDRYATKSTLQTCDREDRRVVEGVGNAPVARVVSNRKERCGEKRAGT